MQGTPDRRASQPDRPLVRERAVYEPVSDQEAFIVPLLRDAIQEAVARIPPEGGRLLDAGCGEQPLRRELEARGWAYFSLDVQQNQQQNVDFLQALDDNLDPDLALGHFDVILCLEVLEHVFDWRVAVTNLAHLLSPGGVIVCTAPFVYELHEEPYDFWRPTPHALSRAFGDAGLSVDQQARLGDGWDILGTVLSTMTATRRSTQLRHRAIAKFTRLVQRGLMRALLARRPGELVNLQSPYFLSNFLVATKPVG